MNKNLNPSFRPFKFKKHFFWIAAGLSSYSFFIIQFANCYVKLQFKIALSRVGRATALSLPDNHAEIVGRKETRPT
jgi:hypothetical protein